MRKGASEYTRCEEKCYRRVATHLVLPHTHTPNARACAHTRANIVAHAKTQRHIVRKPQASTRASVHTSASDARMHGHRHGYACLEWQTVPRTQTHTTVRAHTRNMGMMQPMQRSMPPSRGRRANKTHARRNSARVNGISGAHARTGCRDQETFAWVKTSQCCPCPPRTPDLIGQVPTWEVSRVLQPKPDENFAAQRPAWLCGPSIESRSCQCTRADGSVHAGGRGGGGGY